MSDLTEWQAEYRPSSSLILASKQQVEAKADEYDYKLLLIKRTERTSYAVNHCVFPGGVFEATADESAGWLEYFADCGISKTQLEVLSCRQSSNRPRLMTEGQYFSRDISLRLTALRECFEEVGILLCRSRSTLSDLTTGKPAQVVLHFLELEAWQQRVHNDAKQFLQLCKYLQVVPDLWGLSEWSVWRTAATAAANRKYDTVYYIAALESNNVLLQLEQQEVQAAYWLTPIDCWRRSHQADIWLPFMLLYEIGRLMSMRCWKGLLEFSRQRSVQGSTLLQPIYYRCDDCMFGVLPGDELYLAEPYKFKEYIRLPGSMGEINARSKLYNRYMAYDFYNVQLASNVQPLDGHLRLQAKINTQLAKL
ncbi:nucleoside diphosphate-linked moiety X motif 19 [Drosophila busckii]|uniref:nucleoside diphosphate-linked moiety X motif 19 n=1 Tax=Drosophila busckii TaxID=30019 RepID=UPI001432D730|nr:nucleoside diphosphate-linked moiety X motif 19 [Drosophila busckii]